MRAVWASGLMLAMALGGASACASDDDSSPSGGGGGGGEPPPGEAGSGGTGVGGEPNSSGNSAGGAAGEGGGAAQGGQPDAAGTGAGGEGGAQAPTYSLIDDFEDGNAAFSGVGRHFGWWFTAVDRLEYGTITPSPFEVATLYCRHESEGCAILNGETPPPGTSVYPAARFGGVFGSPTSFQPQTHDASAYTGITFWAQGEARIRFEVMMPDLVQGVGCMPVAQDNCNNGHKLWLELTPEWKQYFVPFAELEQDSDWGEQVPFDPTELYGFFLWFEEGTKFSAAFDDFAFY